MLQTNMQATCKLDDSDRKVNQDILDICHKLPPNVRVFLIAAIRAVLLNCGCDHCANVARIIGRPTAKQMGI